MDKPQTLNPTESHNDASEDRIRSCTP
ncbi:hypothetical protein DESC_720035 [Desulfosarcina cetonica]|nr:hypothetical protein DESC_720035 [Desulfosarcina cetonica]